MRVLVTGHAGYIGPAVMEQLRAAGHEPVGRDAGFFWPLAAEERWDVRNASPGDFEGVDAVVHLAGLSNDPMGALDPELTLDINWRATARLAKLARDAGVKRFVFSSSCSVYGAASEDEVREDSPLRPLTAYAESKARAEEDLAALATTDFTPVAMRNATAYGASENMRADLVVNSLVGYAVLSGVVRVLGDGTPWRPLVHQDDIARAAIAALEAPASAVSGRAFNVGSRNANYQVREIAELVADVVGCPVSIGAPSDDARSYRVNFDALYEAIPSFAPKWDLRPGVEDVLRFYREHELSEQDFTGSRYVRLVRLQELMSRQSIDGNLRWELKA